MGKDFLAVIFIYHPVYACTHTVRSYATRFANTERDCILGLPSKLPFDWVVEPRRRFREQTRATASLERIDPLLESRKVVLQLRSKFRTVGHIPTILFVCTSRYPNVVWLKCPPEARWLA